MVVYPLSIAALLYLATHVAQHRGALVRWPRLEVAPWVGFALHGAGLAALALDQGSATLDSLEGSLTVVSLLVVLVAMWARSRPRMQALSALQLSIGAGVLVAGIAAPGVAPDAAPSSGWFALHAALVVLAFVGFILSFGLSIAFIGVRRRLKHKELRGLDQLPSLHALDRLNFQSMAFGFVALTVGGVMGAAWGLRTSEQGLNPDLTVYGTALVWLWYAIAIHTRLVMSWQALRTAAFGLVGFSGLVALAFSSGIAFRAWHGFGA